MLTFSAVQLEAFARDAFVTRMGLVLPEAIKHPQEIEKQLTRAREAGFTDEMDCARWVICAWCLGKEFDQRIPAIAELLAHDDVGPAYKSRALELMVRAIFVALAGRGQVAL